MIPEIAEFPIEDWVMAARLFAGHKPRTMMQAWASAAQPELTLCEVWAGAQRDHLVVYAHLVDVDPKNRATVWNEKTWMLGDVFECFFQAEGHVPYLEYHVTPENQRLQLRIQSREAFLRRDPIEDWMMAESQFESAVRIAEDKSGWRVLMRIPWVNLLDRPRAAAGERMRMSFCRYDYQPGLARPVMSSVSPYRLKDFHLIDDWLVAEVGALARVVT